MQNPMSALFAEFQSKPVKSKLDKRYGQLFAAGFMEQMSGIQAGTNYFARRNDRIKRNREFATGQHDMQQFLDFLGIDGKQAFVNLDLKSPSIAPKYIRRMIERFMEMDERPTVEAVDSISKKKKVRRKDEAEFRMRQGQMIAELSMAGGMNLEDPEAFVPEDSDDLELWYEMEDRLEEEVKFEKGIWNVMTDNGIPDVIKRKVLEDIMIGGFACLLPYFDDNKNIKVAHVEQLNVVHSLFRYDDARDCNMIGVLENIKVTDFRKMYPDVSEDKVYEYAKKTPQQPEPTISWNEMYRDSMVRPYDDSVIQVFRFRLKSVDTKMTLQKRNRRGRLVTEEIDVMPEEVGDNKQVITKNMEVVYVGDYVVNAQEMVRWEIAKNMIKPHFAMHEVFLDYVLVMPENSGSGNVPIVESMIPNIRRMVVVELKIQQLIAKMRVDGIAINPKRLSEIDLGQGPQNPMQIAAVWEQSGVLYYDDIDENGETRKAPPIQPLEFMGTVQKIASAQNIFNWYESRLMADIGSNESTDGIKVNDRKGLGVMQNQMTSSNRANNFIYRGWLMTLKELGKRIAVMLWYNIVSGPNQYTELNGEEITDTAFDLNISMLPNDEERAYIDNIINTSLGAGIITFEEAFKVRRVAKDNIKMAERMLAKYEKRRKQQQLQEAQNAAQANAQQQMASNQQTHENTLQLKQVEGAMKIELQKLVNEGDKNKLVSTIVLEAVKANLTLGTPIPDYLMPLVTTFFQNIDGGQQLQIADTQAKGQQMVAEQVQQNQGQENLQQ